MTHAIEPDDPFGNAGSWSNVPSNFRDGAPALPEPWEARFGPLRRGTVDRLVVVGQIGQSIDGRIATVTGHSKYINGPAGLAHLHRLRALVDAVSTSVTRNPRAGGTGTPGSTGGGGVGDTKRPDPPPPPPPPPPPQ